LGLAIVIVRVTGDLSTAPAVVDSDSFDRAILLRYWRWTWLGKKRNRLIDVYFVGMLEKSGKARAREED
jgi:hypothetical protein